MHLLVASLIIGTFSLPPAVATIAVLTSVYLIIQALKLAPWFEPFLQGWVAIVINVALNALGTWIAVPAAQFWTLPTITLVIVSALGSAGIHGTVKSTLAPATSSPGLNLVKMLMVAAALSVGLAGCGAVAKTPPTAPAVTALNVLNQVQADVEALQAAEIAAVNAGLIDASTNAKIQTALKQEALDATALATAISSTAAPTTVQAKVDALLADLQTDITNGSLAVKDAKTKATLTAAVAVAEIAVNGIMSAYNAGK